MQNFEFQKEVATYVGVPACRDRNKKLGNKYSYILTGYALRPVRNTELCNHNAPAYNVSSNTCS